MGKGQESGQWDPPGDIFIAETLEVLSSVTIPGDVSQALRVVHTYCGAWGQEPGGVVLYQGLCASYLV